MARLRRLALGAMRCLKLRGPGLISVAFVDGRTMQALNWRFLRHRGLTDVLSFRYAHAEDVEPHGQNPWHPIRRFAWGDIPPPDSLEHSRQAPSRRLWPDGGVVGEIVIAPAFARSYAAAHGLAYGDELARYLLHGLLHWIGHADRTRAQQRRMRALEDHMLEQCGN